MGLLNFAGKLIVGTLEVGLKVGGALLGAAWDTAKEADQVRRNSSGMSNSELLKGYMDNNNSVAARMGYGAELKNRYRK